MSHLSRTQFLRGNWRPQVPAIRPPWAVSEPAFSAICDACKKCIDVCAEKIIQLSAEGLPVVDFSLGACTFCGDCVTACDRGALVSKPSLTQAAWQLQARISANCLAVAGTNCIRCIEDCEHEAILSTPALGGRVYMRVDPQLCTGCGACVASCPVTAVVMEDSS